MKTKRKTSFAIIGCGRIAHRHAEHISKFGILKAVCDTEINRAIELGSQYDAAIYYNLSNLLENEKDVDVISVCTPNGMHAEHTIQALQAGFHVLCEKPMAIHVHDCGRMINEAEKANRRLFIVKQNRFNPPIAEVKRLIDEDILGKIFSIQLNCYWNRNEKYFSDSDWKGTLSLDGGTLFTQFSHFIDLLFWIVGDIEEVYALTNNYTHAGIVDFEDAGVAVVRFYNNVIGTINFTINSFQKNMEGSLTIFAENGTVKIGGQYLNELEYQKIKNYTIENLPTGNSANNYGDYQGSMSNHDQVYKNVIDVLSGNGIIATNGYEGMKTVEIINKIYSSAKRNRINGESGD